MFRHFNNCIFEYRNELCRKVELNLTPRLSYIYLFGAYFVCTFTSFSKILWYPFGYTELFFIEPGVKINGAYYHEDVTCY